MIWTGLDLQNRTKGIDP